MLRWPTTGHELTRRLKPSPIARDSFYGTDTIAIAGEERSLTHLVWNAKSGVNPASYVEEIQLRRLVQLKS